MRKPRKYNYKIKFQELKQIMVNEFALKKSEQKLKGSQTAQDVRALFFRLAFIYCDGNFHDIRAFLDRPSNTLEAEVQRARVLMVNPYYRQKVEAVENKIKWRDI